MKLMHSIHTLLLLFPLLLSIGCGSKHPLIPTTGEIFINKQPATGALVIFSPVDAIAGDDKWAGGYPRGTVDAAGKFKLSTHTEADGAYVGNYIVLVTWTGEPTSDDSEMTEQLPDLLEGRYATTESSPLRAEVIAGNHQVPRIELTTQVSNQ